jgi:uncharacterized membrane protein
MAALADVVGVLVIVAINTALAAILTRFFRLQLETRWGSGLYAVVLIPIVQLIVLLFASGVLGLGGALDRSTAIVVTIVVPLGLGAAIDVFWMPPPEAVDDARAGVE